MNEEYSNDYGKVWIVGDDVFVLEKYYDYLDELFLDEDALSKKIINMNFSISRKLILSLHNKNYRKINYSSGYYEPNGPKNIWAVKFDLEYHGE
jgi:hypothetical protein